MTQYTLQDTVIIDTVRTAMGRSKDGMFRQVRSENLIAHLIEALAKRNPNWRMDRTDDVILGCVKQTKEQGLNIARNALLLAGMPHNVPGQTVNRLCGSSMQALHNAHMAIQSGVGACYVIGGVEHMGHIPMDYEVDINPAASLHSAKASNLMGITAEMLARFNGITREQQDAFAARSHRNATIARDQGYWDREIVSIEGHDQRGFKIACTQDEIIRSDTTVEMLATLRPSFDPKGSVTAGNASALSDGASAMLVCSYRTAMDAGLKPRARVKAVSVAGCDPALMGRGPVPAIQKILSHSKVTLDHIETIELNEAFAAQSLSVLKELNLLDHIDNKVNLQGGAIALGHPLGCSGSRIVGTLLNIMERQETSLGLATMCIGLGQGIATLIERL